MKCIFISSVEQLCEGIVVYNSSGPLKSILRKKEVKQTNVNIGKMTYLRSFE